MVVGSKKPEVRSAAEEAYKTLESTGVEVLYDDREEVSAGIKFADADLIGLPLRLVVSEKSLAGGGVELKRRTEDKPVILPIKDLTLGITQLLFGSTSPSR